MSSNHEPRKRPHPRPARVFPPPLWERTSSTHRHGANGAGEPPSTGAGASRPPRTRDRRWVRRFRPAPGRRRADRPPLTRDRDLYRRILQETRPLRRRLAAFLVVSLLGTPLALLSPLAIKIAVDSVLDRQPLPGPIAAVVPAGVAESATALLVFAAILQVTVVAAIYLQSVTKTVLETSLGERITLGLQSRLLEHVQRLSFAFHDRRGTSDSTYRIQYDARSVRQVVSIIPFFSAAVTFVAMLVVIVQIDIPLALVALGVSPLLYWATRVQRRRIRPKYKEVKRLESSALGVVQEVLSSFRVVKAFGREDHETQRFTSHSAKGMGARIRVALQEGAFEFVVAVTTASGTAIVLYMGVRGVQTGRLTLGDLLLVIGYLTQLYGPLQAISQKLSGLQDNLASAQRVYELLDETPEVADSPDARPLARAEGSIVLDHVSFGYEPEALVLGDLNLSIPAGARVGISGRTGAGKTTLVSLLTRFYDPTQGRILLDGVDLRDYPLADLRSQFAIVLQDPVLFSTSIADNIRYARLDASDSEIEAALASAGASEFIAALPDGKNTIVGERGMRLSGGERQRISLARAFLKDAPILILDEPTSSVDIETEAEIMAAMERLMEGRTALMIAHRLSTLEICDLRIRLEAGQAHVDVAPGEPAPVGGEHGQEPVGRTSH